MDMDTRFPEQRTFFSTSRREEGLDAIDDLGLVPAPFAHYRDLSRLRHDFPVVLPGRAADAAPARSLSGLVDEVLRATAPKGMEGERLRRQVLGLEREMRARTLAGASGKLSELWEEAAARAGAAAGEDAAGVLRHTFSELKVDGDVIACDAAMPERLVTHAWEVAHAARTRVFRATIDTLVVKLSDILRAAFIHSAAGQRPEALRASVASPHADEFDFDVMSRLLERRSPRDELQASRRGRIEGALAILRTQRFYADPKALSRPDAEPFTFCFSDCATAAAAFRARLPALVETVKAIATAELEADGRYDEARHDAYFRGYGDHALTAGDLALFPDYLVCIAPECKTWPENANLMEILSSGMPVKVLVRTSDALEEAAIGAGRFAFGVRSTRLAMTATGLGGVFVLQAPGSNLHAMRERIAAGFAHRGPALFSVFAGAGDPAADLPPYLTAAAAMAARAFPTFSYDPDAGDNLASRFSFENNPQPETDWPLEPLEYCDDDLQRVAGACAFTFADFALCDRRHAPHFARVPRERWNAALVPVADWLTLAAEVAAEHLPYVVAVDGEDRLHRLIVDARLMQEVRRCRLLWHRLQEQGGIHNSHAERLLARERAAREEERKRAVEAAPAAVAAAATTGAPAAVADSPGAAVATAPEAPAPAVPPGTPWIETARCPSCNECQLINDRMFLYDGNKQAYIGDLKAGTYRQMVEAAESCQVSIIHPGEPWDPGEAGLAELVERALAFR